MTDSIETARKTSERENRALLSIKEAGPLQIGPNKSLILPVRISNIGKTTASEIVSASSVEILPRLQSPHFSDTDIVPIDRTEVGDRLPGDTSDFSITAKKPKGDVKKGGETEDLILSEAEYKDLYAGNTYVAVHGRLAYTDVFHVRHWTGFCYWFPFTSLIYNASDCVRYNTVDEVDEL